MIPEEYYLYPTGYNQIAQENRGTNDNYEIDIKECVKRGFLTSTPSPDGNSTIHTLIPNNGLFWMIKGATFPLKTFPDPNAIFSANLVKAHLIETLKLVSKWYLMPFLLLINRQNALNAFNRISMKAMSAQLLHDVCLTEFTKSFKTLTYIFMKECGFTEESSKTFALIFAHLVEFDNVYRLRIADTFSETDKERLKHPQKEIKRLTKIMKSREVRPGGKGDAIHRKFSSVSFILRMALLIPKIKRAYLKALESVDITNLQLDENDKYWLCFRTDYKWMGLDDNGRKSFASEKGWEYPKPMVI